MQTEDFPTIYNEFISTSAKIKLLKRINHNFNQDTLVKTELEELLIIAEKLNTKRNSFIHSSWAGNTDNLIRLETILPHNYKKIRKLPQKFNPQDIQGVVEEIAQLSAKLGVLLSSVLKENREYSSE